MRGPGPRAKFANYLALQLGWFAAVIGAARGYQHWGALVCVVLTLLHLIPQRSRRALLATVFMSAALGLLVDSMEIAAGSIRYAGSSAQGVLAPLWIVALWALLGTTLHFSMNWLRRSRLGAAAFGAIGGPLGYWGGERLEALTIGEPRLRSLIVFGALWGIALPLLAELTNWVEMRLDQSPPSASH